MSSARIAVEKKPGNLWEIRISGMLKKSELEKIETAAKEEIRKTGKIKILAILEDFLGWERGADWGDMTFFYQYGDEIERIAIVGDPKWESEALMFSGAGLRHALVRYFSPSELAQARLWIMSQPPANAGSLPST